MHLWTCIFKRDQFSAFVPRSSYAAYSKCDTQWYSRCFYPLRYGSSELCYIRYGIIFYPFSPPKLLSCQRYFIRSCLISSFLGYSGVRIYCYFLRIFILFIGWDTVLHMLYAVSLFIFTCFPGYIISLLYLSIRYHVSPSVAPSKVPYRSLTFTHSCCCHSACWAAVSRERHSHTTTRQRPRHTTGVTPWPPWRSQLLINALLLYIAVHAVYSDVF